MMYSCGEQIPGETPLSENLLHAKTSAVLEIIM